MVKGEIIMSLDLNYKANELISTINMSDEEWLNYRRKGIGGSDVAAVLGISKYKTARDVYFEKLGKKPDYERNENWVALEYGKRLESLVAEIFSNKTGFKVWHENVMLQHPLFPFMIADTDFLFEAPDGTIGILECKTGSIYTKEAWESNTVPYQYEVQCRHYLSVKNCNTAYIACLFGNSENDFIYRKIERDIDFEEMMIEQEDYFWNEYVKNEKEPELYGTGDAVLSSLKRYHTDNIGEAEVIFDSSYSSVLEQIIKIKSEKTSIDKASRNLENKIKTLYAKFVAILGNSTKGKCIAEDGSEYLITYKPSYRVSINKDNLEKMQLNDSDMFKKYATSTESRQFQVKKV